MNTRRKGTKVSEIVKYDSERDGEAVISAAINSGYQVELTSLTSPIEVTRMWMNARERFNASQLEQGLPSDFRAGIKHRDYSSEKEEYIQEFLRVPLGGRVKFDSGNILISSPEDLPIIPTKDYGGELGPVAINPNLSEFQEVWRDNQQNKIFVVWTWDGTIESFKELISSFQLNGSLLQRVTVKEDKKTASTKVEADYHSYRSGNDYSIPFLQGGVFAVGPEGNIVLLDRGDPRYTLLQVASEKRAKAAAFKFTAFSQGVYANGIELTPTNNTPWYKKPWVIATAIAVLAVILGIIFFAASGNDEQPQSEVVVEEVEEVVEPKEEVTQEQPVEPEEPVVDETETEEVTETPTEEVVEKEETVSEEDSGKIVEKEEVETTNPDNSGDSSDGGGFIQDLKDIGKIVQNWWSSFWDSSTGKGIKDDIDNTVDKIKDY